MLKLYKELKRRKVIKTLGVYGTSAVLISTTSATLFPFLLIPDWTLKFAIGLAILGFPITLFLSWTYNLKQEIETGDNSEYIDGYSNKKSRKVALPLTDFLTISGSAFWLWYSLGNITIGSDMDLQMGIKKSIAVLNIENLSGKNQVIIYVLKL